MTTIDDLTQATAAKYDIPTDAARDVVTTYVNQISDDPDLWNADDETLTTDGVDIVTTAIETAYEHDLNSSAEDLMLAELEDIIAKRAKLTAELDERRDELVRSLMKTSVARKRIAAAADLSEPRLYQIRDGRR